SVGVREGRPQEMRRARARHEAALRGVMYGHGGSIVKMTGDGVFAVFGTTLEAVASAAESLRTLASDTSNDTAWLRIRVGIHTGTAEERDGDFYGTAPNLTNRLMGAAHGGPDLLSAGGAHTPPRPPPPR